MFLFFKKPKPIEEPKKPEFPITKDVIDTCLDGLYAPEWDKKVQVEQKCDRCETLFDFNYWGNVATHVFICPICNYQNTRIFCNENYSKGIMQ